MAGVNVRDDAGGPVAAIQPGLLTGSSKASVDQPRPTLGWKLADLELLAAMAGLAPAAVARAVSLAAGVPPAARIVMLRGVREVRHG